MVLPSPTVISTEGRNLPDFEQHRLQIKEDFSFGRNDSLIVPLAYPTHG
jgi:hypothetical protein